MEHTPPNLARARAVVEVLEAAVDKAAAHLASQQPEENQTVAYDLASISSAVAAAAELLDYGAGGRTEADLALLYAADVAADLAGRMAGRESLWGVDSSALDGIAVHVAAGRDPAFLERVAERVMATREAGPRHLSQDLQLVRSTFRGFAEDRILPVADRIHRDDEDIPADIIDGLAGMGCFGLSIPAEYGGYAEGGADELLSMVVVTEELSRASLGAAGSLITRPEIIGTAIARGGTEEQKRRWLPAIAAGEKLCGVAVTEPDHGSDVARVTTSAIRDGDDWVLNGVKTWCTFAGRAHHLLVLARTDPDRTAGHRGLALFVVEKPSFHGHEWSVTQDGGGSIEGRAIRTLGYRGMHSFEVRLRPLARPRRRPDRDGRRSRARVLPSDAGIRQRAATDRRPCRRGHAVSARTRRELHAAAVGLRPVARGLPADPRQDRQDGRVDRRVPDLRLRGGTGGDGQRRSTRSSAGEAAFLPGSGMGHPGSAAAARRLWVRGGIQHLAVVRRCPGAVHLRRRR